MTKPLETDVIMITTHNCKSGKRVKFQGTVSKLMLTALLATSIATSGISTMITPSFADAPALDSKTNTVEQKVSTNIDFLKSQYRDTLTQVKQMVAAGTITEGAIKMLALQLDRLNSATNGVMDDDTQQMVSETRALAQDLKGKPGVDKLQKALDKIAVMQQMQQVQVNQPEYNAKVATLKDISNHWGKAYIQKLVNMGGISGYADGTFKPDKAISNAEFLSIAMGAAIQGGNKIAPSGNHWASGILDAAIAKGIVKDGEITNLDASINRYDMARILVRIDEGIKQKPATAVGVDKMQQYMGDYNTIPQGYQYYVTQAYLKGLITGTDSVNSFLGNSGGNRAQAATMVLRVLDSNARAKVDLNKSVEAQGQLMYEDGTPTVEVSKKYSKLAVAQTKVVQENGKYYVVTNLPKLPGDMQWVFSYTVRNLKGAAISYTKAGEDYISTYGVVKQEMTGVTASMIKQGYPLTIAFGVTREHTGYPIATVVNSDSKAISYIIDREGVGESGDEKYDVSKIFAAYK